MRRLLPLLLLALPAFAAKTTVTDVLVKTNGGFCSGTISIQNPAFTSIDGPIAAATVTTNIKSNNGVFTIALEPGPYYTATYVVAPSGCTPTVEFWSVPISATPVDLATVRSVAPPPPLPNTIPLTYITQSGATTGQCAAWNGTNWAPAACSASSGSVTSVGLVGTADQITVAGASPITTAGTFTLSLPSSLILPNGTTATTQSASDNSTKVATTAYVDNAAGCLTCVTAASTLTSSALMTGAGSRATQTPSSTALLDSSGNISTPGSISAGIGSGVAGTIELAQGTAPSLGTTSVKIYAPASVTSFAFVLPAAAATGVLHATNAANIDTLSISSVVSADLNLTTTTCTNQFLTAISATGTGTCTTATLASAQFANQGTTTTVLHGNGAGNPSFAAVSLTADVTGTLAAGNGGTGITSLGTGVATALGLNVSGTGAICLASGSACSGAGSDITIGTTTVTSGTTTRVLFNNAGVVGEYTISGTGNVCMTTSCSMTTPVLGTPTSGTMTNVTGTATGLTSGITNALKSATTTVDVSAATAPTSGQVLTATGGTAATWQTPTGGVVPQMVQVFSGRGTTKAYPFNVTSGHTLVVGVGWEAGAATDASISDTLTTTWTRVVQVTGDANANCAIFTGTAGSSGADTITLTLPAGGGFSGISPAEFVNLTETTDGTTSGKNSSSLSITTTTDGDLILDLIQGNSSSAGSNPLDGFVVGWTSSGNDSGAIMYQVQPKAGKMHTNITNGSGNFQQCVVALKHS